MDGARGCLQEPSVLLLLLNLTINMRGKCQQDEKMVIMKILHFLRKATILFVP